MKLTRKRFLIASVVLVAVIGGAWSALANHGPPCGVTRSAFDAIRPGMTIDDVDRIIGHSDESGPHSAYWIGEGYYTVIVVSLNEDRLVCEKQFYHNTIWDVFWRKARSLLD